MKNVMKSKYLIITILLASLLNMVPALASISKTLTFSRTKMVPKIVKIGDKTYHQISYSGLEEGVISGAPNLPCKYVAVEVPKKATNFSLSCTMGATENMYLTYNILPVIQCITTEFSDNESSAYIEDSLYYNNDFFPTNVAKIVGEEFRNGDHHYVIVAVTPFKYIPLNKKLHLYKSVRFTLNYDEDDNAARDIMPVEKFTQNSDERMGDDIHIGGDLGSVDSVSDWTAEEAFAKARTSDYVVITDSEKLKQSLKRFVALKKQKGYNVEVVTVDEVLKSAVARKGDVIEKSDGSSSVINDSAGKIRAFLRSAYKFGSTQYVLLAGDSIPYRKQGGKVPTDWYYCDLNTDWYYDLNTDLNNELNKKSFDFGPELYVGRIFASSPKEINNYSDKVLKYELNPGDGDASYLQNGLYVQAHQMKNAKEAELVGSVMNAVFPDTTLINCDDDKDYPKGSELLNELNAGYGFVSLHLHGEPTNYLLAGHMYQYYIRLWAKDDERIYNTSEVNAFETNNHLGLLNNKDKPNVVYSIACVTNPYDAPHPFESVTMNLGKAFTSGYSQGGSVAYLGNTREGYVLSSARLERNFAELVSSGITTLGEAEALSKQNYRGMDHVKFTHNLIGDPTLKIWTNAPQKIDGVNVQRSNNSITVTGLPLGDSCYVAYSNNLNNEYVKTLGSYTFSHVNPNGCIMVYNSKTLPFIAPLKIQNESICKSQYILASSSDFGKHIDTNRTFGDVIVKNGVEYTLEAKGKTVLHEGFKVENGAKFSVIHASY